MLFRSCVLNTNQGRPSTVHRELTWSGSVSVTSGAPSVPSFSAVSRHSPSTQIKQTIAQEEAQPANNVETPLLGDVTSHTTRKGSPTKCEILYLSVPKQSGLSANLVCDESPLERKIKDSRLSDLHEGLHYGAVPEKACEYSHVGAPQT